MIVNDPDLLPLNPSDDSGKPKPPAPEEFNARVAESYDSIELLLAAREEAEQAEAKAKEAGETPLPFAKEAKQPEQNHGVSEAAKLQTTFNSGGLACDEDS